jgi:hypothetical protein
MMTDIRAIARSTPPWVGPDGRRWRAPAVARWVPGLTAMEGAGEIVAMDDDRIRRCSGVILAMHDTEGDPALDIVRPLPPHIERPRRWQWGDVGLDWIAPDDDLDGWAAAAIDAMITWRRDYGRRPAELSVWAPAAGLWVRIYMYGTRSPMMPDQLTGEPDATESVRRLAPLWWWSGAWTATHAASLGRLASDAATIMDD